MEMDLKPESFCFVTDTVAALLLIIERDGLDCYALNIGRDEETTIIALARKTMELSSSESKISFEPFPPGDHKRGLPEIRKARKMIKWIPKVELEDGLEQTVKWFLRKAS